MKSIKDILDNVFKDLNAPEKSAQALLAQKWPGIIGPKLIRHTKPKLDKFGNLTVWVDNSTLAFELKQRYQSGLMKRVKAALGENEVKKLRILVGEIH